MNKKNKVRITALSLVATLLLGGCSKKENHQFEITENEENQLVAMENSYIDNAYIDDYYVVEIYNYISKQNEIYILRKTVINGRGTHNTYYHDVFTNTCIFDKHNMNDNEGIEYIKETPLQDYLITYGLTQQKYTYEDMQEIYEVIKENYTFENDNSLKRKLINNNKI